MSTTHNFLNLSKIKTFGYSMIPLLHNGDIIFINKIEFKKVKLNDIVCVTKNNKIFTHRVVFVGPNFIISKGDNNIFSDGKIYPKNLIGVVKQVQRGTQKVEVETLYLMQSTFYFKEIIKIKKALENNKIDFLFLKGLPIHLLYEKSYPRRLYADCDVLIDKKSFARVKKTFKQLGYSALDTSYSSVQKKLKKSEVEMSFSKVVNGATVSIDVHLEAVFLMSQIPSINALYPKKFVESFTIDLLNQKRYVELLSEKFPILSGENLFVYLILHLFHHNFIGSYRYDLIIKVLQNEKLDFKNIIKTIQTYKLNNFVYPVILLLVKNYGVKIEASLLKEIKPNDIQLTRIKQKIKTINIFDSENRVSSGVNRFRLIYDLSPAENLKKLTIFLNPQVVFFICWFVFKKTDNYRLNTYKKLLHFFKLRLNHTHNPSYSN